MENGCDEAVRPFQGPGHEESHVVMTIHDAVYVEAPDEEENRVRHLMKEQMEAAVEMPVVPLEVDIE
jgi:DNA polymerase I-like protein with 3'-5' exonuclease and polymerase domains